MKLRTVLIWWLPVLGWCGLIFWLSGIPSLQVSDGPTDFWLRKTAHLVVYALLFLLVYRAIIKDTFSVWSWRVALTAFVLTVLYGMSDELHQSFVPTRNGNWFDVGIDAVGSLVAMTGLAWWGWWNRVLKESERDTSQE